MIARRIFQHFIGFLKIGPKNASVFILMLFQYVKFFLGAA